MSIRISAASELANLSERGVVLANLDVLIGDVILGGSKEGPRAVVCAH